MDLIQLGAFLFLVCGACTGLQWPNTIVDNAQLEICSGEPVKLQWRFNLSKGEVLKDIEWRHQAKDEENHLVASYEEENFVPTADFSGRISHEGDAAIELSCATILDTGVYTVVVRTADAGRSVSVYRRSVAVMINDTPKTKSGGLEIRQERIAVRDVSTHQWHVDLTCGHFSDRGHPPLEVVWKTPDGKELSSSSFNDGHFHLLVPNPVKGGNYSCGLPSISPANKCLPPDSALFTDVTVYVDEVNSRLALQEAQLEALRMHVENQSDLLNARIDLAAHQVSFHATLGRKTTLEAGERLQSFSVISNVGLAFNGRSGEFSAPVNGTYFFIGTTGSTDEYKFANMRMMNDGVQVSQTYIRKEDYNDVMGSCHAALHLNKGQKVWLESSNESTFWRGTTYSGFLINADV